MPPLRFIMLLLIAFLWINTKAQNNNYMAGARMAAMADASVAISDIWSGHHNQAGLARLNNLSAGVSYVDRYNLKELGIKAATILLPTNGGNFGLSYTQMGFELMKENKIGIAYARPLGKHLWAGIQMDYFSIRMQNNLGSTSSYTFEAGILAEPFHNFFLGFHLFNPIQTNISTLNGDEELPVQAHLGCAWNISKQLIVCLDTQKDLTHTLSTKIGLEYEVINQLHLRAGVASHPNTFSMGLGYSFEHIITDIAFWHHPVLGNSPAISLNLIF